MQNTNKNNNNRVRVYDFETKTSTEIPIDELAPGYALADIQGLGLAYVNINSVKPNPHLLHPPFNAELKELMHLFSETFKEVYPLSPDEWELGFRKDRTYAREIEVWVNVAGAYGHFSKGVHNVSKKEDIFKIILSCFSNGAETTLRIIQPKSLSRNEMKATIARLKKGG